MSVFRYCYIYEFVLCLVASFVRSFSIDLCSSSALYLFGISLFRYFFSYVIWFAFCSGSVVIQFVWYVVIRVVRYFVR